MARPPLVLVVDDDPHIRQIVRFALTREGYGVEEAGDGVQALRAFERSGPDLIVLDLVMPELDGTEVCRALRARSAVPIIMLSSKDDEIDRVVGLELGADDYVTKPFSPRELVARVRTVLRRARPAEAATPPSRALQHGKLRIDLDRHEVAWDGRPVELTATEFSLLRALAEHPGRVYTREELMARSYDDAVVSARTIDSHLRRVRAKLLQAGGEPIETLHGVGYRLGPCT